MRRKAKTAGRRQIPAMRPRKTHEEKSRALLRAGYEELGSEARRLEREFARLDSDPVLKVVWENKQDAAYDQL